MRSKKLVLLVPISIWLCGIVFPCKATISDGWNLPPFTLSDYLTGYSVLADSLSMAMDEKGNAIAIWKAKSGSHVYLAVARFEAAVNAWNQAIKKFGEYSVSGTPILQLNKEGDAFIMWQEQDVPDYIIRVLQFTHDTPWASWLPSYKQLSVNSFLPFYRCAINGQGDALFVFGSSATYKSTFYDHTIEWLEWLPSTDATPIDSSAPAISISLDNSGKGVAVYTASNDLYATQYASSTWTSATQLNTPATRASSTNLAMEPISGKAYIMWAEDNISVHATQLGQTAKTIDTLGISTVGKVKELIDIAGNVTLMWTANDITAGDLKTTYFDNSDWNSWSPSINTIASSASNPITQWNIAGQPASPYQVLALWELHDGTQYLVQANEAISGAWLPTQQDVFLLGNNQAIDPQIGIDASGNATATWGQAAKQPSVTKILISAIWYNATTALWQEKTTILSNSGYCNCA